MLIFQLLTVNQRVNHHKSMASQSRVTLVVSGGSMSTPAMVTKSTASVGRFLKR